MKTKGAKPLVVISLASALGAVGLYNSTKGISQIEVESMVATCKLQHGTPVYVTELTSKVVDVECKLGEYFGPTTVTREPGWVDQLINTVSEFVPTAE